MFKYYLLCSCLLLIGCQTTDIHTINPKSNPKLYYQLMAQIGAQPDNSNNTKWTYCINKQDGYDIQRDKEFIEYINQNTTMKFLGCKDAHAQFTLRDK